ncbi:TonB family protein [Paraburkholderia sp.]|uniref:TonB family protein n=1 Tax=Paraburkholderia sp. TaxID=1926495 RepID=UPI003D6F67BD
MEMTYNGGPGKGPGRFIKPVVIVLLLVALAAVIWHFASDTTGVKRAEAPQVTTVIPLPPPPPPPPPQKPPPEKPVDVKTPVDKPTDVPKPADTPKPSDNQPKQMTMNAPAQAGTDNFGIGAGDGSGMAGSGGGGHFGNATYQRYLGYLLQQALERDKNVQDEGGSRFDINVNIWMEPSGSITKVAVVQSSGDTKLDDAVVGALMALGKVDEPPPGATYPKLVKLHGKQPA